jgi:glycosyltransferase involved in cell wall biosynthesis
VKLLIDGDTTETGQSVFGLSPHSLPRRVVRLVLRKAFRVSHAQLKLGAQCQFLRAEKIQAVLAEYGTSVVKIMEACCVEGVPLIVHFHGFDAYDTSVLENQRQAYARMFEVATGLIVRSRDMERQLVHLGALPGKIHRIPHTVDPALFTQGDPSQSPPHFLAVGRFVDKKAPYLTLLAFGEVFRRHPNARLTMIGDGPLLETCQRLACAFGIEKAVEFTGPLPQSEVAIRMRASRAFVQHSVRTSSGDCEGTPAAVVEAGATGIPVIATRHAGIPDIIEDNITGVLVDEGDVKGMAECMCRIAADPQFAAILGKAAYAHVCRCFMTQSGTNTLWYVIHHAIENRFRV